MARGRFEPVGNGSIPRSVQSDSFGSPSSTSIVSAGCSPLLHAGSHSMFHQHVDRGYIQGAQRVGATKVTAGQDRKSLAGPWLGDSFGQVLRIHAHRKCGDRISPNLPGGLRGAQALQKPGFLFGSQNGLRRALRFEIGNDVARIHRFHRLFRHEPREGGVAERVRFIHRERVLRTVASLIGDDQLDVTPPAERAIPPEAVDRREIVRRVSLLRPEILGGADPKLCGGGRWLQFSSKDTIRP